MSISDLVQDGSYATPVRGDGYLYASDGHRSRFDIWVGDKRKAVPFTGDMSEQRIDVAEMKLRSDWQGNDVAQDRITRLFSGVRAMGGRR